jgi:hypothetical protein
MTDVYTRSRDYLGPFEIAQANTSLFLHARVEGAPVTYAIVERSVGEAWRRQYETAQPMGPSPGMLFGQGTIPPGEVNLGFPVNPGVYYVVIENAAAPSLLGMAVPVGEQVARVRYSVEMGDRK